jgi:hypothetical protein
MVKSLDNASFPHVWAPDSLMYLYFNPGSLRLSLPHYRYVIVTVITVIVVTIPSKMTVILLNSATCTSYHRYCHTYYRCRNYCTTLPHKVVFTVVTSIVVKTSTILTPSPNYRSKPAFDQTREPTIYRPHTRHPRPLLSWNLNQGLKHLFSSLQQQEAAAAAAADAAAAAAAAAAATDSSSSSSSSSNRQQQQQQMQQQQQQQGSSSSSKAAAAAANMNVPCQSRSANEH